MVLQATCDVCGKIINGEEIYTAYDGRDLCYLDKLKNDLESLKSSYDEKEKWFESIYYSEQREKLAKIKEIQQEIIHVQGAV